MSAIGSAVECDRLTVRYQDLVAVDRVSFEVGAGEVFGLLGPNGAGKTSVIRALTTILAPADGAARVAGAPLTRPAEVRSRIGVLPESNGYPNSQTPEDYLTFYAMLFGIGRAEATRRARRRLSEVGLAGKARHRIGTFSRGMRQRLGLARALVSDPQVLFLDEPTLGLDPAGREEILRHLTAIAARGDTSVLLCSHLLDDIERICDRVAILHEGRIVSSGSVAEVGRHAGVGTTARVTVDPACAPAAHQAALAASFVLRSELDQARRGEVLVHLRDSADSANALAGVLLQHDIPFRSIELRGARLSDAFLALTGPVKEPV